MGKVLARVTQEVDGPRGPDVELAVRVPPDWLALGATLEIELPRNLACARCSGGGCDSCGRAGAVSLRGRQDPGQSVEVTLPRSGEVLDAPLVTQGIVLRIPEQGGVADDDPQLPRGHLLLRVRLGDEPDAGVARIRRTDMPVPAGNLLVSARPLLLILLAATGAGALWAIWRAAVALQ